MRELEKLVLKKDAAGFYDSFAEEGESLSFMEKIYIESSLLYQ